MLQAEVASNPIQAKAKGAQARADMVNKFAPDIVAKEIEAHFERIQAKLEAEGAL
jgi:hypothetical protein